MVLLEQQLETFEQPQKASRSWLLLVLAGALCIGLLSAQAVMTYATIVRVDANSNIATANPVVLFQDIATNGPRVGATVDASSRATYTKALEQFVLDGTGMLLGLVLVVAGVFARANL
jgi:hypothetical protein